MKKFFNLSMIAVFLTTSFFSFCFGQELKISVNTKTFGGINSGGDPEDNVVAIWIQTPEKKLIKTLMIWSYYGFDCMLKNWRTIAGLVDTGYYDGVTSATRDNHEDPIKVKWDCKDTSGELVPYGTYEFWIEMNENDWWWGDDEKYLGRIAHGKIKIDAEDKVVYGDSSDTCIYDFKATYVAPLNIVFQAQKQFSNKTLSYFYNPVKQKLTIKLNSINDHSVVLYITNLKGELLEKVKLNTKYNEFYWDLQNSSGQKVCSGVYIFEVRSADSGKPIIKAFSITLLQ